MSERKKNMKNLLRRGLLTVAALVVGISIYRWNAASLMGNRLPMPFGFGIATVLSGSMEPTLSVDDLVLIGQADTLQVGDVVVYQDGNSLVIHRIIDIRGEEIIAQGDANNTPDKPVSRDAVKGKLLVSIPGVGMAIDFFRQPVVVVLMLAMIVYLTEQSFRKEKEQDSRELDAIQDEIRALLREMEENQ